MCRERLGDERDRQYDIAAMKEANALSEENVTSQLEILNKRIAVISHDPAARGIFVVSFSYVDDDRKQPANPNVVGGSI